MSAHPVTPVIATVVVKVQHTTPSGTLRVVHTMSGDYDADHVLENGSEAQFNLCKGDTVTVSDEYITVHHAPASQ